MAQQIAPSQLQATSSHGRDSSRPVVRHPLISYFVLAYSLSWVMWLPLVLSKGGGIGLLPFTTSSNLNDTSNLPNFLLFNLILFVGALGPAIAALIVSGAIGGGKEVKHLLRRMVQVRIGIQWYMFAVFVPLIPWLILGFFGGSSFVQRVLSVQGAIGFLLYVVTILSLMILGSPLGEEPGWRGFALPRLQQRYGPLAGSLVLGPLWALWHLPLFFTAWGASYQIIGIPLALLLFTVTLMGFTIVMTWLFNNTKGSIFLAILFHAALDAGATFLVTLYPQASTSSVQPGTSAVILELLTMGLVWIVIAGLLLAFTRGKLSYKRTVESTV